MNGRLFFLLAPFFAAHPAPLESQGSPSMASPLGGANAHWAFA
ncbi:MAG: hypothetical protein ACYC1T_04705 [Sulfuricaulis sp.]